MALYSSILGIDVNEARRFTGRRGQIHVGIGVDPPATPSVKPGFKIKLQGASGKVQRQFAAFSGGGAMAAATATWEPTGTATAGAIAELTLDLTINSVNRRIAFQITVQSGDTLTNMAEDMEALLAAANNGDATPANAFIRGLGPADTTAQLKSAMENLFGTTEATAFANTGAVLTLTLGTTGTDGNNTVVGAACLNSAPSPIITPSSTGTPNIAGFRSYGDITGFTLQNPKNTASYTPTNTAVQVTLPTTTSLSAGAGFYFNVRPDVLAAIQADLAGSSATGYDLLLPGGAPSANVTQGARIVFTFENDNGGYDIVDLYKCFLFNLDLNYSSESVDPVQAQIQCQPISSRSGDPLGYFAFAS